MALDTLDPNRPLDGDAISLGDDAIRETRQAVIDSFKVEHTLAGVHTTPLGGASVRPAAGVPGRLFLNTDTGLIEVDNGTTWIANRASIPMSALAYTGSAAPGQWVNLYNTSFAAPVNVIVMGTMTMSRATPNPDEVYSIYIQTALPFNPPNTGASQFFSKAGYSLAFAWAAVAVSAITIDASPASGQNSPAFNVVMNGGMVVI